MPPPRILPHVVGRSVIRWIAAGVVWLHASLVTADHGVPLPAKGGLGWTSWLLIAGAVAAVSLAAWAFFAPERGEPHPGPKAPDALPSEPPNR